MGLGRVVVLLCVLVVGCSGSNADDGKSIVDLITQEGFFAEEIAVETQDGYVCTMHRVVKQGLGSGGGSKGAVLLQHGFLDSADTWVMNRAQGSLAFILANAGYDVFLGNSRGNKYSERHVTLSPDSKEFWQFSWDDMASHDIPAFVDKILQITNSHSIAYVGHSQGTTQMYAALISQPQLTQKIHTFVALAPVTYLAHTTSRFLKVLADSGVDKLVSWFGVNKFLPDSKMMEFLGPLMCTGLAEWMCDSVMWLISGYSADQLDKDRLSVYMSHFPSGTSMVNVQHWAQSIRSSPADRSDFSHYSYSEAKNVLIYGTPVAPIYNLTTMPATTTLLVFSGGKDDLANPEDVSRMIHDLPFEPEWISLPDYDHLDFVWGENAHADIYSKIVSHLNSRLLTTTQNSATQNDSQSNDENKISNTFVVGCVCAVCALAIAGTVVFTKRRQQQKRRDVENMVVVVVDQAKDAPFVALADKPATA